MKKSKKKTKNRKKSKNTKYIKYIGGSLRNNIFTQHKWLKELTKKKINNAIKNLPDNFQNIKLIYLNEIDSNRFLLSGFDLKIEKNIIIKHVDKKEEEYTKELCDHNHKNIIELYQIIEIESSEHNFLIFEHNGISMEKYFKNNIFHQPMDYSYEYSGLFASDGSLYQPHGDSLTINQAIHILREILIGIKFINEIGYYHNDITWKNVVISIDSYNNDFVVKIIDFGLAEKIKENNMNNDDLFFWFPNLIKNCLLKYNLIRDIRDGYIPPNSHSKLNEIIDFVTKLNNKEIISHDEALIHPFFNV